MTDFPRIEDAQRRVEDARRRLVGMATDNPNFEATLDEFETALGERHIAEGNEPIELNPGQRGPCPGHEWAYTGTAYGGDDESYHGEGRCYCVHCGADGDA